MPSKIFVKGARENNLKNIDVEIPRDALTVISGLSGSGKSSLAFDTIYAEGQRRYVESLSSYARMFLGQKEKPDVDYIEGKIKEIFSPIKMPKNAKERVYPAVPDYNKTVYGIGHDKEMNVNVIEMSWLSDPLPQELRNTQIYYMTQYMQSMISMMLNNRFNEITSKPDAPFAQADVNFGGFLVSSRVKDAF